MCKPLLISEKEYLANKEQDDGSIFTKSSDSKLNANSSDKIIFTEDIYDSALALVHNRYGYSKEILSSFCEAWKKAHKITPKEYINMYNNNK